MALHMNIGENKDVCDKIDSAVGHFYYQNSY